MNLSALQTQLEQILQTDAHRAADRLRRRFAEVTGGRSPLVLVGAGALGRKLLGELRRMGVEPVAWADNRASSWDQDLDGLKIHSLPDALRRFGDTAAFVVTVYNGGAVRRQLHALGCSCVVPFTYLYWHHADQLLPYCSLDFPERFLQEGALIRQGLSVWADDESRAAYVAQLQWRLDLETDRLPAPRPARETYFPDELVRPVAAETFVDCGAFDGDTVRQFLERRQGTFREIVALEPDAQNFTRLQTYRAGLPPDVRERILPRRVAAAAHTGTLNFDARGTMASAVGPQGSLAMDCVTLDELLAQHPPTYIKMDIEGAERDALDGARHVIAAQHPVLAICAYHRQDDLWRLPLQIKTLWPGYRLVLRVYAEDCWELVCYAIPPERCVPGAFGDG